MKLKLLTNFDISGGGTKAIQVKLVFRYNNYHHILYCLYSPGKTGLRNIEICL